MPKTKRYREARQAQQEGELYTDALRRSDAEHERQRADRERIGFETSVGPRWSEIGRLTAHLQSILARLKTGEAFTVERDPFHDPLKLTADPETLRKVVDRTWKMELISATRLLAEEVRIDMPQIHPSYLDFSWATPSDIDDNPFLEFARRVVTVAEGLLKAVGA